MSEFFYNGNWKNWHEGLLQSGLGTGDNDKTFVLSSGGTVATLERIKTTVPGGVGDITVEYYDGASVAAGTALNVSSYIGAQADDGYLLRGKQLTTGSLTIRIAGRTSGGTKAYHDVLYFY